MKGVESIGGSESDVLDDRGRDVRDVPVWVGEEGHWERGKGGKEDASVSSVTLVANIRSREGKTH